MQDLYIPILILFLCLNCALQWLRIMKKEPSQDVTSEIEHKLNQEGKASVDMVVKTLSRYLFSFAAISAVITFVLILYKVV